MEMLNTKPELVNRRQRLVSQFVKRTRVKKKGHQKNEPYQYIVLVQKSMVKFL